MHMADALLSPAVGGTMLAVSAGGVLRRAVLALPFVLCAGVANLFF